ncbi:hypothetical protein LTS18_010201 [Coniosporium uncinatum]|uniref:Uncharacterized protein n=1 Tax=Coniosporium uncinatum TaxID=93489 RepID=A0ACC3DLT2_9PEZI|nr:hypothetical protein LTS18_010201 [Coniosporium uncinatum]
MAAGTSNGDEILPEGRSSLDSDEFVDARENMGPPSPGSVRSRHGRDLHTSTLIMNRTKGGQKNRKTNEELELENSALRQLLDTQSRRLQMWEASSQSQSLALAQSMRGLVMPQSGERDIFSGMSNHGDVRQDTLANTIGVSGAAAAAAERLRKGRAEAALSVNADTKVKELEALLEAAKSEREQIERDSVRTKRENEKLAKNLQRYREQWEVLKAGARGKMKERSATASPANVGGGTGAPPKLPETPVKEAEGDDAKD